jgi:hypothetical protein
MNFILAVQALVDAGVDFVIIGGWSAILHGSAHMTDDLDICFSRDRENLRRLAKALAPYHPRLRDFPPGLPFIWDDTTLRNGTVFTLSTDLGVVDLLAEVAGVGDFADVKAHSVTADAFERSVLTLDLPSLIRSKRATGRVKDLQVLPELESLADAEEPE